MRARYFRLLACALTLSIAAGPFGCGKPTAPPTHAGRPLGPSVLRAVDRVRQLDHPNRPPLRLVHRSGDPSGAVALAIATDGRSASALALGALLDARLGARDFSPTLRIHRGGVIVAEEAENPDQVARTLDALERALTEPVGREEATPLLDLVRRRLARLGELNPSASEVGACLSTLGSEGRGELAASASIDLEWFESVRKSAATARRASLSALGEPTLLDAAERAHTSTWPAGEPLADDWPSARSVTASESTLPSLRVAHRIPSQTAALAARRALAAHAKDTRARIFAIDDRLTVTEPELVLGPAGACLSVEVDAGPAGAGLGAETAATVALALGAEMAWAREASPLDDESALALLAPESALDAVALAAWAGLSAVGPEVSRELVEYRAPEARSRSGFAALLERTERAFAEVNIPLSFRFEGGQAESWLLVASPCGTRQEPSDEAGLLAVTVRALALESSGDDGVTVEPWVSVDGVGLVLHAPPRRGESPSLHAERIARAAGRALYGSALDGRVVASARGRTLALLGDDPGRDTLLSALSGGTPSRLSPSGIPRTVATLSTADVERARIGLASGALRVAYIASQAKSEEAAAQRALASWLAPARPTKEPSCSEPTAAAATPGVWTLEPASAEIPAATYIGVPWSKGRLEGAATAWLLGAPGGPLQRALATPDLLSSVTARYWGGSRVGALVVELRAASDEAANAAADQEASDALPTSPRPPSPPAPAATARQRGIPLGAEAQIRAALDALARLGVDEKLAADALAEATLAGEQSAATARGRLVQTWNGSTAASGISGALDSLAGSEHRIVRVEPRR